MSQVVVIVDLPIGSADDISETELALLLQNVRPANIIDYTDLDNVDITMIQSTQPFQVDTWPQE